MKMKAGGPDGLEAWCVALSACFINFVMAGLGRMSGILYVVFIDTFQVNRLQASVPFSARSLARNLFGPVVGILGQKYGVRAASVAGGIIGTISAAFCFYADSILWITVLWGAVNGVGTALCMTLPQVVLSQHFQKYRTTASGMAFSGGCVGSFLFPVVLEYLLHIYGIGGTFLIFSGIIMNTIPAAMILNKPSWLNNRSAEICETNKSNNSVDNETFDKKFERNIFQCSVNSIKEVDFSQKSVTKDLGLMSKSRIDTEFMRQNNRLILLLLTTNFADTDKYNKRFPSLSINNLQKELEDLYCVMEDIFSNDDILSKEIADDTKSSSRINVLLDNNCSNRRYADKRSEIIAKIKSHMKTESREALFLHLNKLLNEDMGNIITLFPEDEHRSTSKIIDQLRCMHYLLEESEKITCTYSKQVNFEQRNEKSEINSPHTNTFSAHIKTAFRLHTNPIFLLISLCRTVHFLTFVPAVAIIVDYSMDKGLSEEDGKYVIAALSFGDLAGRLCLGWVTDKGYLQLSRYMLFVMVIQGACTASLSLMNSKITLLSTIAIFGLLQGSLFVRHPVLVSKYLGSHEQSVAMGCFNFLSGLLGFTFPSYIGYFRDTIGSYDYIFYINGAIGTLVGIMWLFEPYFVKCIKRNDESNEQAIA